MRLVSLSWFPTFQSCSSQRRRRPCRPAAARRNPLRLERLEERVVLDTVTFAQFIHIGGSPQVFRYSNHGGASADFSTIPGGDPILLSFDSRFAPGLTGPQSAHLFLTSNTSAASLPPLPGDDFTRDHFSAGANTIQITLDTPVDGKTNFLTVTYSDILSGRLGSHEASLRASDAASGTPPDTVHFASDFINFTGTINHGLSLSFSSVDSDDGSGGLQQGDGGFFKSFTAAGTGTFDTNFSGAIAGQKFQDTNGNGIHDPGEPGLPGWTIVLDSVDGATHLATVTDAAGNYSFTNLDPGAYRVSEGGQPGWVQVTVNPGDITVLSASTVTGVDFGNFQLGAIAGQKFQDTNGDGLREPGEPGLQGWTIDLDSLDGTTHLSTVTDANGNFSFANLPAGTYQVHEVNQPGWVQTTVGPGDVTILSGSRVTGLDFGNFQPGSIAGQKFQDTNGNGIHDPGEPGLEGWTIDLDAIGGTTHLSTVTDANGNYNFANLPAGTYQVHEVNQPGWVQTTVDPGVVTILSGSLVTGVNFGNRMPGIGPAMSLAFPRSTITPPVIVPNLVSKLLTFEPNLLGIQQGLLAADSAFVAGLYQNLLNRPADGAGLGQWVQLLLAGITREQAATAFWQSSEHRGVEVDQFYATFLGRDADAGGRALWVNALLSGTAEADVIRGFLMSPEYQATHASDVSFINGLYSQILDRPGDPASLSAWLAALQNGLSRRALVEDFLTSAEADQKVVDNYYALFLNRLADRSGERQWTDALLRGGATIEAVGATMLASDEYFARVAGA
jgi:uncharacterized protein (DUF2141 family)